MFEPYSTEEEGLIKDCLEASEHPELPTIIGVAKDVKPLVDLWVTSAIYKKLKPFCKKYNLIIDHDNYMGMSPKEDWLRNFERKITLGTTKLIGVPYIPNLKNTWLKVFISRSQKLIDEAKRVNWYTLIIDDDIINDPPLDNFRFGENLGFPQCCIDFYSFHNFKFSKEKTGFNTPIEIYKNTKGKFSIYCNNIIMGHWYFLIRHHPCSFNCKNTVAYAKTLHKAIREEDRVYADKITQHLKYPLLVYGEKNAFVFDGKLSGKKIKYKDTHFCGAGRDKYKEEVFKEGNEIKITNYEVSIYKDGDFVTGIEKKDKYDGVLMKFD